MTLFIRAILLIGGIWLVLATIFVQADQPSPQTWLYYHFQYGLNRISIDGQTTEPILSGLEFSERDHFQRTADGDWIIYISAEDAKLHRTRVDGSDHRFIGDQLGVRQIGQLSDDGQWLTFVRQENDQYYLVRINLDGSNPIQLAQFAGRIQINSMTSDETWIVVSVSVQGNDDLYWVRTDGTDLQQLTSSPNRDRFMTVTRNDKWLIYSSDVSNTNNNLYRIRLDGTDEGSFSTLPDGYKQLVGQAVDGAWVLFHADTSEGREQLYRVDLGEDFDGDSAHLLIDAAEGVRFLGFSPDNTWLTYQLSETGRPVYRVRPDGTQVQQLTFATDIISVQFHMWLPDSDCFVVSIETSIQRSCVADDGQVQSTLVIDDRDYSFAGVSPDGAWIILRQYFHLGHSLYRIRPDGSGLESLNATFTDTEGHLGSIIMWVVE